MTKSTLPARVVKAVKSLQHRDCTESGREVLFVTAKELERILTRQIAEGGK